MFFFLFANVRLESRLLQTLLQPSDRCKKAKVHPSLTTGEKGGKKKIQTLFFYPQGSSAQESPEAAGSLLHPWGDCSSLCWEKGTEHYLRKQWGEECVCRT